MKRFIIIVGTLLCLSNVLAESAKYLIIAPDSFVQAVQPLADWKTKKGILAKVVPLSVAGNSASQIKSYILNAYNNWLIRPEYILLAGLGTVLPNSGSYDDYFANMTGDYRIELNIGRFPCVTVNQCQTIVSKTLGYERTPLLTDTTWFKKGTGIVREDVNAYPPVGGDTIYWNDVRYIYGLWQGASYVHIDSFSKVLGNTGTDVINAINNGRAFVVYRGQATVNWYSPFQLDPSQTSNGYKLPIVVSGTCATISLSQSGYLGGNFLNAGTSSTPKGAVGFFGSTISATSSPTLSRCRGAVTQLFYKAIFEENIYSLGKATKRAKFVADSINLPGWTETRYKEWNLLGDPELNLWTAVPQLMAVTHERYVPTGSQSFTVTVKDSFTHNTIHNALVCVMMPSDTSLYYSDTTDVQGNVTFTINPRWAPDSICVTVTTQNYRPYEGKCLVLLLSPEATYPNQGHHLVRKPNSSQFHRVYEDNGMVLYSKSTNLGQTWSTPAVVDTGWFPSIALSTDGNTPWILYVRRDMEDVFKFAVRRTDGTWKIRDIYACEKNERTDDYKVGPSLMLALMNPARQDLGYGVFSDNYDRIFFVAFDTIETYCQQVIDESYPCLAPSIAITPEDRLHVVWQRGIEDGQIFYKEARNVNPEDIRNGIYPEWSREVRISTEPPYPLTEPASNPSTEAYGEYVYAAWRGPNYDGEFPGDIWRRARRIWEDPDVWEDPRNMSETPLKESNFPVMSTDFVTVWHESISNNNWDICAKFEPDPSPIRMFKTPTPSKYPHIDLKYDPRDSSYYCNTIWTEETLPSTYIVKFGRYQYIPPETLYEKSPLYYEVEIGDANPSPYCVERTGYLQYGQYGIDYGNQRLKYKLPYLNPNYYYDIRAITYQRGNNNWQEQFYIDSAYHSTVNYIPDRPETVWVRIPKSAYENDTKILQKIGKVIGNWAVIADLRLYQVEEFDSTGGGSGPQSAGSSLIQRPILYQSYPNPFKSRTAIRYSLPTKSKVSLLIYNISGQLVKTLINQHQTSGIYSVNWDGRDDKGRTLAQGIYFYRLKTNGFSNTKRLVLIR